MTCTTHHHACDCREAKFVGLEAENAKLRAVLEWIASDSYKVVPSHWENIAKIQSEWAREALKE